MVRTSRNAKKVHRCPICKCSFFSYSENSTLEGSHRSHRNGNPNCRIELARQREDYRRAGNIDELRFPYADYVEDDEASMCDEGNHGNEIEVDEIDNDAHEEMKELMTYPNPMKMTLRMNQSIRKMSMLIQMMNMTDYEELKMNLS